MYTQITCPNCQTPYTAEIHQVIDSDETPDLKQRLLAGQLNVAVCPNCGAGGQMITPMLFHHAAHEMIVIFMPQEMNMGQISREVKRINQGLTRIEKLNRIDGGLITPEEMVERLVKL